ncbi:hypothetical protein BDV95DRAFT_627471 [Massariosphaeria phaeospora]|uniref:LIM zinc-binding domain-containing protein n=1 Tax=Massariosphaeria phaeospora TaxID=100035 RepID=A0A7C8I8W9_9PLEO|nr:hypothetical protein BDV95DRAFT_627471 [Massariosphaeria phaeospora]
MANPDRQSFLPTIKCSNCAAAISISQLADHVCVASAADDSEPTSPKLDRAATFGGSSFNNRADRQSRLSRMPAPPRIDPSAANKPFGSQISSPISSYSSSKNFSPLSPSSAQLPFKMNRSATSPIPRRKGPPSPELPLNMDCAFPRFPTSRSATPSSPKSKNKGKLDPAYSPGYAEPSPLFAPLSPRTDGGESVLKRMNTIAPGPFGANGTHSRPSTSSGPKSPTDAEPKYGHRRTTTQDSSKNNGNPPDQSASLPPETLAALIFSNSGLGFPTQPKSGMGAMAPPPLSSLPSPPAPAEGIDAFLQRLQNESVGPSNVGPDSRSQTPPMYNEPREGANLPPKPRRPSSPHDSTGGAQGDVYLNSATFSPPRAPSRGGSKTPTPKDDLPPLPSILGAVKELPPNPLHTPSDSGLSDDSYASSGFRSVASSRSSPPGSEVSGHSREPSHIGRSGVRGEEQIPRTTSPENFMPGPPPPIENFRAPEPLSLRPPIRTSTMPHSPVDPAIQRGLNFEKPSEPQLTRNDSPLAQSPPKRMPGTESRQQLDPLAQTPPKHTLGPVSRKEMMRRPTTATKGKCRGCSEDIVGKSVKDSSGRLTGRYHKQCFTCRTCSEPFPGADFYVFNNFPYCEQHYHELNGSLCHLCNRGIEGQYLETDQRHKFHPRCFTCSTCRIVLRDGYFPVGNRVFCERHAHHAASQRNNFLGSSVSKNPQNLQKRRTRLMMMM